jgi:hypothetical protein
MHHDPFQNLIQNNPILASHYAAAGINPLAAAQGGILPHQLTALLAQQQGLQQLPGLSAATGIQNPGLGIQNPALATQNPALLLNSPASSGLQAGVNPLLALASVVAQQLALQQQSPYSQLAQPGVPFGQGAYPQLGQIGYAPQQFGQASPFTPMGYPQQPSPFGYVQQQFGQGPSPFGQIGYPQQIGNALAPQSWVGQGGQLPNLLSQFTQRPFQGAGISPWGW